MLSKRSLFLLISLIPVYISLAFYLPSVLSIPQGNLSQLLRLAKTNIRNQLKATSTSIETLSTSAMSSSANKLVIRRSQDRGHADHDWLKTFHTFSFAMYQDFQHEKFGPLRVINEDRVAPRTGFGTHSHREFEIFSYVVAGELEHKDSMGNVEVLKRGDLQMTSAGTGISHSEKAHGTKEVHFLQIWALPSTSRLQPKYFTRHFSDTEKTDRFVRIVAPAGAEGVQEVREAEGPAPVHSPLTLYATLLSKGKTLSQDMKGKKGYVHVVMTSGYNTGASKGAEVKVDGETLKEGDGAYMFVGDKTVTVENVGDTTAEVLLFDLQ